MRLVLRRPFYGALDNSSNLFHLEGSLPSQPLIKVLRVWFGFEIKLRNEYGLQIIRFYLCIAKVKLVVD